MASITTQGNIDEQIANIRAQIDNIQKQRKLAHLKHQHNLDTLNKRIEFVSTVSKERLRSVRLNRYYHAVKDPQQQVQYVTQRQAVLCQTLHRVDCIKNQMDLCAKQNRKMIKSMNQSISMIQAGKMEMERRLMNQSLTLEGETRELRMDYDMTLKEQQSKMQEFQEKTQISTNHHEMSMEELIMSLPDDNIDQHQQDDDDTASSSPGSSLLFGGSLSGVWLQDLTQVIFRPTKSTTRISNKEMESKYPLMGGNGNTRRNLCVADDACCGCPNTSRTTCGMTTTRITFLLEKSKSGRSM